MVGSPLALKSFVKGLRVWADKRILAGTKMTGKLSKGQLPRQSSLYYLKGQGDLISRLIMGITRVIIWVIGVSNLMTNKSP